MVSLTVGVVWRHEFLANGKRKNKGIAIHSHEFHHPISNLPMPCAMLQVRNTDIGENPTILKISPDGTEQSYPQGSVPI
jgi:hypothetical protein